MAKIKRRKTIEETINEALNKLSEAEMFRRLAWM
jgi:hypothetical protein